MDSKEQDYIAFTSQAPYGVALVRRRFDGRVAVGAVYQNERALRPILEELKAQLQKANLNFNKIVGLFDDSETATELADLAEDIISIGWQRSYKTLDAARQALESVISIQGPATSKFQIDKDGPGAEFLAQLIDNRVTGGAYDATALCCLQIEEDFPSESQGRSDDIKAIWNMHD